MWSGFILWGQWSQRYIVELIKLWQVSMLWVVWEKLSGLFITVFTLIYRLRIITQSWQLICFCYISGRAVQIYSRWPYSLFQIPFGVREMLYNGFQMTSSFTLTMCSFKTIPDVKKGLMYFYLQKNVCFRLVFAQLLIPSSSHEPSCIIVFWDGHQSLLARVGTKREQSLHTNRCSTVVMCLYVCMCERQ